MIKDPMSEFAISELRKIYKNDNIKIVERLLGGMSNYTYLAKVNDLLVVIRVVDPKLNIFVNRYHELDHIKKLNEAGFTNDLIYFDLDNGTKISKYIKGFSLVNGLLEEDIKETAKTLKRLHQKNLTGHHYDFINRINKYESLLLKEEIIDKYYELKEWWITNYNNIFSKTPQTLVHGDAQRSNLLRLENNKIQLLDFEFTGIADPYYDIASFGNISFSDSIKLLSYYLDHEVSNKDLVKVKYYRMYQVLQWYLVATFKNNHGYSELLKIDFKLYATNYLNFANELYTQIKDDLDGQ